MESLSELNQDKIFGYLKSNDLIYILNQTSNIIGRDTDSTIVLNHPSISKKHAKIEYEIQTNNAILIDLNSTYGTYINDIKLNPNESIKIKSGDIISFGQSEIKYIYLPYYQKNKLLYNDNNSGFQIRDNKISLVNENEYESASINHLNGLNMKLNSFNINNIDNNNKDNINIENNILGKNINNINNIDYNEEENLEEEINNKDNLKLGNNQNMTQIIEETNLEIQSNNLLLSSNNYLQPKISNSNIENSNKSNVDKNFNSINEKGLSLYNEIYNKKNLLEIELKAKINEIKTLTDLYNQLQDNYNKLNAKHNALMIYASDIQKKNDILELEIQNKDITINENFSKNNELNLNKLLLEKETLINYLQEENQLYKEHLGKIKERLKGEGGPNNLENKNISNSIEKLNNEYLSKIIKIQTNYK